MKYLGLLFSILLFTQCGIFKSKKFENDFMLLEGISCKDDPSVNAIDSQNGKIVCDNITLSYDYGRTSFRGLETNEELFVKSFDAYHHTRFFEDRLIDPKVYKIFLDSVKVIEVLPKNKVKEELMIECDPCNAVAHVTFMKRDYYYPYTVSPEQLETSPNVIEFEDRGEYLFKYYHNDEMTGVFLDPKKNRFSTKNRLSVVVESSTLNQEEIRKLLYSIEMKTTD